MWIDLSWPISNGMPVYPGDRETSLVQEKWVERDHYVAFALHTGLHAGTHMDAPMHLLPGGAGVHEVPLSRCFAPGIVLDVRGQRLILPPKLSKGSLAGKAVLLYTGLEYEYGSEGYYQGHPEVSMELAELLARENIAFLGVDMPSPDFPPFPVHKLLLSHGIPIVENLRNLCALPASFEVAAIPLSLYAEASLVRAVARGIM